MHIETVVDQHAIIGESPLWVPAEQALYWADIKAPALHRFHPATAKCRSWRLTSDIGGFALMAGGAALVALRYGIHRLDLDSGELRLLAPPPFDPALFRFNEGACDARGRFWIGVMFDPLSDSLPRKTSSLHSFTLADGLRAEADLSDLHNGMAWSVDGQKFFLSHSYAQTVYRFDYEPDDGRLSNRQHFATIPPVLGIPDGAAIDAQGGYWCALHGGGRLRRFLPDGSIDRDIEMPISQPTMCAFGGQEFETIYVTSASDRLTPEQKQREPLAGALFGLTPGVKGAPRPIYVR